MCDKPYLAAFCIMKTRWTIYVMYIYIYMYISSPIFTLVISRNYTMHKIAIDIDIHVHNEMLIQQPFCCFISSR